jgi:hypothetical protein
MSHNFEQLKDHILPLSSSNIFKIARTEWDLVNVEISEELDECPCGKEIKEHCYIRNRKTGKETYVGNVCINRFMGLDTGALFAGLKRISSNSKAAPNEALIEHANTKGYLFEREHDFLKDTSRKRNLSDKQLAWREKINKRIVSQVVVKRRSDTSPPQAPQSVADTSLGLPTTLTPTGLVGPPRGLRRSFS